MAGGDLSSGFQSDRLGEFVERGDDCTIEFIESGDLLRWELRVSGKGGQQPCGERGIDLLEQFEENDAQAITLGGKFVSAGSRDFLDQSLAAKLRQVVTEGTQFVLSFGTAESFCDGKVNLFRGKAVADGEMAEAD